MEDNIKIENFKDIFAEGLLYDLNITNQQDEQSLQLYNKYFVGNEKDSVQLVTGYGKSSYVIPCIIDKILEDKQ